MLLCWGLAASLRDGTPMNCSGCDRKNPAIPSPSDNPGRRMTRAEAEAMERAFWRSVEIIDDIDDREEVAPGDVRYYRPPEKARDAG